MTAEFAVAVPAVVLVLAGCLGGLRVGVEQIRVTTAAAAAARSAARDDPDPAAAASAVDGEASLAGVESRGDLRCATARATVRLLGLPVPVAATSCALGAPAP